MEETKRRRFIIRAVLEGEVDVQDAPPVPEYPKSLTDTDPGVGFGSYDPSKNMMDPPYVANTNHTRIHFMGENGMGYPVQLGKSYRISIPEGATAYAVSSRYFNEDGIAQIQAVSAISASNTADSGWINLTDGVGVFTPAQISGKDPLYAWFVFKKNSAGNATWSAVGDICPIVIEEI